MFRQLARSADPQPPSKPMLRPRRPVDADRLVNEWLAALERADGWQLGGGVGYAICKAMAWCHDEQPQRRQAYWAALAGLDAIALFGVCPDGSLRGLALNHAAPLVMIDDNGSAWTLPSWSSREVSTEGRRKPIEIPALTDDACAVWEVEVGHVLRPPAAPAGSQAHTAISAADRLNLSYKGLSDARFSRRNSEDFQLEIGIWRDGLEQAERLAMRGQASSDMLRAVRHARGRVGRGSIGVDLCRSGRDARDLFGIDANGKAAGLLYHLKGGECECRGDHVVIGDPRNRELVPIPDGEMLGWRVPWELWR